jgi:hypothetical protein
MTGSSERGAAEEKRKWKKRIRKVTSIRIRRRRGYDAEQQIALSQSAAIWRRKRRVMSRSFAVNHIHDRGTLL